MSDHWNNHWWNEGSSKVPPIDKLLWWFMEIWPAIWKWIWDWASSLVDSILCLWGWWGWGWWWHWHDDHAHAHH